MRSADVMAARSLAMPRLVPSLETLAERHGLAAAIGATMVLRALAALVLRLPLDSDPLAYYSLADTLARTGVPFDQYGNHAFFSPGYFLLLTPFFSIAGASVVLALAVNVALAGASAALVWSITHRTGGSALAATIAGLLFACWIPGLLDGANLMRENLSIPLLLGFVRALLAVGGARPIRAAALAGLCYGMGLLAGTAVALTVAAAALAVSSLLRRAGARQALLAATAFAACAAAPLLPWLAATDHWLGRPVLVTNGPFNVYIGNNPAADGRFVSMRFTPMKCCWRPMRAAHGELGASDFIAARAEEYIMSHPARVAGLAATKLALFWAPNLPDDADFAASRLQSSLRLIEVAEYCAILAFAALALARRRVASRPAAIVGASVVGYWLIHAAAYIIPRYRDPVMPLLIVLAAFEAAALLRRSAHAT